MEYEEFENLIKDALLNLYDYSVLEHHPLLMNIFSVPEKYTGGNGRYLHDLLTNQIETLKPKTAYNLQNTDWRSYIVLEQRYVLGVTLQELSQKMSLSERQIRRVTRRAIQMIAYQLWDQYSVSEKNILKESAQPEGVPGFKIHFETLDLTELLQGVLNLLESRFVEENINVIYEPSNESFFVNSDRIIIRQILIAVLNQILHFNSIENIKILLDCIKGKTQIKIIAPDREGEKYSILEYLNKKETMFLEWCKALNIQVNENYDVHSKEKVFFLTFCAQEQNSILIIDDQEPALRMYQRYLSKTPYQIVGVSDPANVIHRAKEIQPALILLDIMMPKVDGWELLQSLKINESTRNIPVIVCSAWGEADLAKSLGAKAFLRKPITQKELLNKLKEMGY